MTDLLITGASRGIGRALALEWTRQRRDADRLVLIARDEARLNGLAAELQGLGGRTLVVPGDLGSVNGARALAKRGFEAPGICGARLARILARERWSPPGEVRWLVEETEQPWPEVVEDEQTRRAVREVSARQLASIT